MVKILGANKFTTDKAKVREAIRLCLELYLTCHTQEEVAETMGVDRSRVSQIINDMRKSILGKIHIPESPQDYNVWNFPACDDRYGLDFPRLPTA